MALVQMALPTQAVVVAVVVIQTLSLTMPEEPAVQAWWWFAIWVHLLELGAT
jgi:hypothetical protein